jgi:hypothetical protein
MSCSRTFLGVIKASVFLPATCTYRTFEQGAYSPLLVDNGFPIVDNGLFSHGGARAAGGGQRQAASRFYVYSPIWQAYLAGNSSNCVASNSCPCLDEETAGTGCAKQGQLLRSRPDGMSWFRNKLEEVSSQSHAKQSGKVMSLKSDWL